MSTTLTWIGGGLNLATSLHDWSPSGLPKAGYTLLMQGGMMNDIGYNLSNDTLVMTGSDTVNLMFASITVEVTPEYPYINPVPPSDPHVSATFNLVDSSLSLSAAGNINNPIPTNVTVNMYGVDTFVAASTPFSQPPSPLLGVDLRINLAAGSVWKGHFDSGYGGPGWPDFPSSTISVSGGVGSVFDNDGASFVGAGTAKIDTNVLGVGSFTFQGFFGSLEFVKAVGAGQTVNMGLNNDNFGDLYIDDPTQFAATVVMGNDVGVIDLAGLSAADSYAYKNDMLSLYSGSGKVIDTLRLVDDITRPNPILDVGKAGGSVYVTFGPNGGNMEVNGKLIVTAPLSVHT